MKKRIKKVLTEEEKAEKRRLKKQYKEIKKYRKLEKKADKEMFQEVGFVFVHDI
jgi:guanylate kinase